MSHLGAYYILLRLAFDLSKTNYEGILLGSQSTRSLGWLPEKRFSKREMLQTELYLGHWFHVDWKRFVSDILNMQSKTSNSVHAKEMQINCEEHIPLSCSLF